MKIKKFDREEFEKLPRDEQKKLFSEMVAGISFLVLIILGGVYTFFRIDCSHLKGFQIIRRTYACKNRNQA